jgi:toxin ParE1/3/4
MRYGLRILPAADVDVDDLALYIAQNSVEQAARFYDAAAATYKQLLEYPDRWAIYGFTDPRLRDLRKYSIIGFPNHLVFYRIDSDMVEIVRVVHGARDLPALFAPPASE